jgi:hypothetical protein
MVTSIDGFAMERSLTWATFAPVNAPVDPRGLTGDCTGANRGATRESSNGN